MCVYVVVVFMSVLSSHHCPITEYFYQLAIITQFLKNVTTKIQNQHHIRPATNFVMSQGPAFCVERWEEQSGYSPSTISAEIAGLVATADIIKINGDMPSANDASPACGFRESGVFTICAINPA